ncbi:MAG: hypothetical protein GF401_07450 [Chitinivibrionales bacterium]|nr:hypothetical protein [Chitinivibrionales bacterium]
MIKRAFVFGVLVFFLSNAWAQVVSFNSPTAWLTQRKDNFTAKMQFDTSKVVNKRVDVVLYTVKDGKEKRVTSKSITIKDYSQDIDLGSVGIEQLGGENYAKIYWSIRDTTLKGTIAPIGIVSLDNFDEKPKIKTAKVSQTDDLASIVKAASGKTVTVGDNDYGLAWNQTELIICGKKPEETREITFTFDGKNAKNGFLAYADKFITYYSNKDSLAAYHYTRSFRGDSIAYEKKKWHNKIVMQDDGSDFAIRIPWSDLGMAPPFAGKEKGFRMAGFSIFVAGSEGKQIANFPEQAQRKLPGSWANMQLSAE